MLKRESDELKVLKNELLRKNEENSKLKHIIIKEKFKQEEKNLLIIIPSFRKL